MDTNISDNIKFENGKVNIHHALQSKWIGTQWIGNGITYEGIEWLETNEISKPSEALLNTEVTRLQAEYDAQEYARNRASEYPALSEQLDEIYHNGIDSWKALIKVTKDKYPKG